VRSLVLEVAGSKIKHDRTYTDVFCPFYQPHSANSEAVPWINHEWCTSLQSEIVGTVKVYNFRQFRGVVTYSQVKKKKCRAVSAVFELRTPGWFIPCYGHSRASKHSRPSSLFERRSGFCVCVCGFCCYQREIFCVSGRTELNCGK
jgi:hypothetical protein